MKKRVPKSECTRKIEWDRSVLKILTFWSRSKVHLVKAFFFSLFFLKAVRTGSCFQVGPVQTGSALSNRVVEDDVIALEARVARASA